MINIRGKTRSGYVMASLLLLSSYLLIFYANIRMEDKAMSVRSAYDSEMMIDSATRLILGAQVRVNSYVITDDVRLLRRHIEWETAWPGVLKELGKNEGLLQRDSLLRSLLHNWLFSYQQQLRNIIHAYQRKEAGWEKDIQLLVHTSYQQQQEVIGLLRQMSAARRNDVAEDFARLRVFFNAAQVVALASLVIACMAIWYSLATYNRESRAKDTAVMQARKYSKELEMRLEELKESNDKIRSLQYMEKFAATGRIARVIAHEVRNPLTNIGLVAGQLRDVSKESAEYDMLLNMIDRNSERINELATNLLQATKFDDLLIRPYDLNQLVDDTLSMARDRIQLQGTKLVKDFVRIPVCVAVDLPKIKISLLNIIINALEAMENMTDGRLEIKTSLEKGYGVIEVIDNGPGMDENTVQKLFEPFFTSKMKGTGLGLTNAQNIVLNHKGNLVADSRPGEGSRFIMKLPLDKPRKIPQQV